MRTRVRKWGNSLALRIPKAVAAETGITCDAVVDLSLEDGALVVRPVAAPSFTLEGLLAGVTPDNVHGEQSTGPAMGNEVW